MAFKSVKTTITTTIEKTVETYKELILKKKRTKKN